MKLGILSDTHGFLNPKIFGIFQGVDLICHAGDIGNERNIFELEKIAPVKAVHGNVDYFPLTTKYPEQHLITVANQQLLLIHHFDERRASHRHRISKYKNLKLIICGHTHRSAYFRFDQIGILNPGCAGKDTRYEPASVALLTIENNHICQPEIIYLSTPEKKIKNN